ncbi:hypothetical protein MPER_01045, partial [Moniliophthora perniciosa FA553]
MFANTTSLQIDRTLLPNLERLEVNITGVTSPATLPAITQVAKAGLRVVRVTLLHHDEPESVWADELRALGSSHPELKVEVCLRELEFAVNYAVKSAILSDLFDSSNEVVWISDRDVVNRNIEEANTIFKNLQNAESLDMLFATLEEIVPKLNELT